MLKNVLALIILVLIAALYFACETSSDEAVSESDFVLASDEHNIDDVVETTAEPTTTTNEIIELIHRNLNIIANGASYFKVARDFENRYEHGLINAHPDEFSEIVALGEVALPYLDEILRTSDDILHWILTMATKYTIKPELYDLIFESLDGKYTMIANVYTFTSLYGTGNYTAFYENIRLIDRITDSTIWTDSDVLNLREIYPFEIYPFELSVSWSPDILYAAVTYNFHGISYTNILNIQTLEYIILPRTKDLAEFFGDEVPEPVYANGNYWREAVKFKEWVAENKVKIRFWAAGDLKFIIEGWYIYDLCENIITELYYEFEDLIDEDHH